ncbi:MAG: asparagine synthase (glutamine-hydrolyzing) [Deltaproteobacteria bacterium]|nr:asparagine synthase (glutamine-hydrolyzing) [Kofleriaceae bacterium]
MCGIAGFSGPLPPSVLDSFVERLQHRGPDDRGTWYDASAQVGLAHTRLSILDLSSRGHQPMRDVGTGCRITYNGELYNFRKLRSDLEARGHRFFSDTDTEVLLRLYLDQGPAMLEALDGIFAFAIWDPRAGELLLARDGLGVKPLYWTDTGSTLVFASEIKALIDVPGVCRGLDLQAVEATLLHLWCPAPRTVLRGVSKLEPGTAMIVRAGKVSRLWRWFQIPVQEPMLHGDRVEVLRQTLARSVADQLVADVPIGAFLSGGVDSSAVVAFAARENPGLPCFTMRFASGTTAAEGFDDDLPYARKVAAYLGVKLVEVPVSADLSSELEDMVYQLDEPQADLAPLNVRRVAEAARDRGIKVLLAGTGGDDLFAGYRRHQAVAIERVWAWFPRALRRGLRASADRLPAASPWGRRARRAFRQADLDQDERIAGYFAWIGESDVRALFTRDVAGRLSALGPYAPLLAALRELPGDVDPVNRVAYLDARYFLADHNLNYTDKMSMAVGVEVRVPLLARRIVELAAAVPVREKLRLGTGKWVLREALQPILPAEILRRSKTGFGVPLRTWLHRELGELVGDTLSPGQLGRSGVFDPSAVQRLLENDRAGRVDAAYPLLAIVCIELWCRRMGVSA